MKPSPAGIDGEVKIMRMVPMIALAFLVFVAFNSPTASAQTKTCTLILDVITHKNDQRRGVGGARATALNMRNRKSTVAVLVYGEPRFSKLADGEYRISVTKSGYKRAILPMSFKCEEMNDGARMFVDLEPGNFRTSVVASSQSVVASSQGSLPPVRRGVTTVLGTSDSSVPQAGEPSAAPPRKPIIGGVLNGKALSLPKPDYPPIARQAHASGIVTVQVVIDEEGNVISAHAISGHPLLQAVSVAAARGAKFSPTKLSGQPVKVTGVITYNFVAQ